MNQPFSPWVYAVCCGAVLIILLYQVLVRLTWKLCGEEEEVLEDHLGWV